MNVHPSVTDRMADRRRRWSEARAALHQAQVRLDLAERDMRRACVQAFDGQEIPESDALVAAEERLADAGVKVARLRAAVEHLSGGAGLQPVA